MDNAQVADILSLMDPKQQIRAIARDVSISLAYRDLRHGRRGKSISSEAARSSTKSQGLGQIRDHSRGEEWFSGRILWASASGQPTTDRAVVFATSCEELLEAMDRLPIIRDISEIPFPQ